mgnify:CR=1 FL=1
MAQITLGGKPANTSGNIPQKGDKLQDFKLVNPSMETKTLNDYQGKKLVLNIFPSVDTGICAKSVHEFNKKAGSADNTLVLNISKDLPFAQKRFCGAEGLENVEMLSDFRYNNLDKGYNVLITDGGFEGLLSRVVIVADENGTVQYSEQVPEVGQEPDYESALKHL